MNMVGPRRQCPRLGVVRPPSALKRVVPHALTPSGQDAGARDQDKRKRLHACWASVNVSSVCKTEVIQRSSSKCPHASGASRTASMAFC